MAWYHHLEDTVGFPFIAVCHSERAISPLSRGDEVEIIGMAPEEECGHEMFVLTPWERRPLAIPLAQVRPAAELDDAGRTAVEDWQYWVEQGYTL